ncbi:MAG: TonB-dependent receptor [Steroidobacteraceae bacterium]|nr:TonB-dependent receptor [Steroidobacteraceae bacterium]
MSTLLMLAGALQAQAEAQAPAQDRARNADAGLLTSTDSNGERVQLEEYIPDIVVTATRQATNLQDTPIAITAVSAEALEERGITNVSDLTSVVPNSQFRRVQGAFGPGVSAFIRGIGSGDTSLAGEGAVAFYIDEVYYPVLLGANFDLLDIDHIEVLRGPQGTLFGRNSLAGALNIVGRQPSLTDTTGYVDFTAGRYDRRDVRAGLNLPLSDSVALMISGLSKQREGYQRRLEFTCEMIRRGTPELAGTFPTTNVLMTRTPNFTPNDCTIGRLGGDNVHAGRVSLLWQASPTVRLTVNGDYIRDLSENTADSIVDIDPTRANNNMRTQAGYFGLTIDERFMTGDPYTTYVTYEDRIPAGTVIPGNSYYNGTMVDGRYTRGGYELPAHNDLLNWGLSTKLAWDFGNNMNLTAVVGYRVLDEIHTFDTDGTPLVVEHVVNDIVNKYLTTEVRLSHTSALMDWVGGVFYFDAEGVQHAALAQGSVGGQRKLYTTYEPKTKAVFANVTLRPFGDAWSFIIGGRYSDDEKVVNFSNLADVSPSPSDIRFAVVPQQKKSSWKLGINYQLSDTALLYTSAASGNSLPGYNPRPLQVTQVGQFDGNDDVAYELGAKLDLWDRRIRLNAAAFYTDFKNRPTAIGGAEATLDNNLQPVPGNQQLEPLPGGPPGSTRCSTQTLPTNTGIVCIGRTYYRNLPATVRGAELEYTIAPTDALAVNGSVGWSRFWSPDIAQRVVNRRQGNPFWTASAGIQYRFALGALGGAITPRLDWTYESNQIVSGTSTKYNDLMPARSLFNARITYDNTERDFTIAAGVTNLFDKFYWVNVFDYQGLGYPQTDAQPGRPREWFLSFGKRF